MRVTKTFWKNAFSLIGVEYLSPLKWRKYRNTEIINDDCIVFKNHRGIKHRGVISSKYERKSEDEDVTMISTKMLSFFLLNPNKEHVANYNAIDCKWISFPCKVDIMYGYFIHFDSNILDHDELFLKFISLFEVDK